MNLKNGKWLAAVSGGPDSMALLKWCMDQGISAAAAHVNYHHRKEAEEEEQYVRSFCRENGIVLHVLNEPFVPEGNFEAEARRHRYAFFARTVRENGYCGVLIGHQMDDLIETYLMQKEKNIIPDYYGLKEERMIQGVPVVRPLLSFTRKELRQYCERNGIRYYNDCTNEDLSYARNRVRHEQVEMMDAFAREMVLREIRRENAVLQERRCRLGAEIHNGKVSLAAYRMKDSEERLTLLRQFFDPELAHASLAHLKEIDHILMTRRDFVIPAGSRRLAQENGEMFLQNLPEPFRYACGSLEEVLALRVPEFRILPGMPGVNSVTVRETDFPLVIRSAKPGDRIRMRFGTKPVHRFFIDRRIPLCRRDSWPVVENAEGEVILVMGLGCDKSHYSIRPDFSVIQ